LTLGASAATGGATAGGKPRQPSGASSSGFFRREGAGRSTLTPDSPDINFRSLPPFGSPFSSELLPMFLPIYALNIRTQ